MDELNIKLSAHWNGTKT